MYNQSKNIHDTPNHIITFYMLGYSCSRTGTTHELTNYKLHHTRYSDDKAYGGFAIINRSNIKHYEKEKFIKNNLQTTSIPVEDEHDYITMQLIVQQNIKTRRNILKNSLIQAVTSLLHGVIIMLKIQREN